MNLQEFAEKVQADRLAKAEELGVPVLNESQFKTLLAKGPEGLR